MHEIYNLLFIVPVVPCKYPNQFIHTYIYVLIFFVYRQYNCYIPALLHRYTPVELSWAIPHTMHTEHNIQTYTWSCVLVYVISRHSPVVRGSSQNMWSWITRLKEEIQRWGLYGSCLWNRRVQRFNDSFLLSETFYSGSLHFICEVNRLVSSVIYKAGFFKPKDNHRFIVPYWLPLLPFFLYHMDPCFRSMSGQLYAALYIYANDILCVTSEWWFLTTSIHLSTIYKQALINESK